VLAAIRQCDETNKSSLLAYLGCQTNPFETGWAMKANWLPKRALIVHAEIYPSVRDPKPDTIKDRGQVTQSELNRETAARPNPHECDQCHFAVQTPRHVGLR
jgi:hypothetical protein